MNEVNIIAKIQSVNCKPHKDWGTTVELKMILPLEGLDDGELQFLGEHACQTGGDVKVNIEHVATTQPTENVQNEMDFGVGESQAKDITPNLMRIEKDHLQATDDEILQDRM